MTLPQIFSLNWCPNKFDVILNLSQLLENVESRLFFLPVETMINDQPLTVRLLEISSDVALFIRREKRCLIYVFVADC